MNVRELREFLADLPDDMLVLSFSHIDLVYYEADAKVAMVVDLTPDEPIEYKEFHRDDGDGFTGPIEAVLI